MAYITLSKRRQSEYDRPSLEEIRRKDKYLYIYMLYLYIASMSNGTNQFLWENES